MAEWHVDARQQRDEESGRGFNVGSEYVGSEDMGQEGSLLSDRINEYPKRPKSRNEGSNTAQ